MRIVCPFAEQVHAETLRSFGYRTSEGWIDTLIEQAKEREAANACCAIVLARAAGRPSGSLTAARDNSNK
jgi:hypothetical protein